MSVLAVILARGGSKGIPKKNIVPLCGHPLLSYTIAAALDAARVTDLVVSTDSEDILASLVGKIDVCEGCGCDAPVAKACGKARRSGEASRPRELIVLLGS